MVDGEVGEEVMAVPGVAVHRETVGLGEVGREARRARHGRHGGALGLLEVLGEEGVLLAEVGRLESVTADHLLLLEV